MPAQNAFVSIDPPAVRIAAAHMNVIADTSQDIVVDIRRAMARAEISSNASANLIELDQELTLLARILRARAQLAAGHRLSLDRTGTKAELELWESLLDNSGATISADLTLADVTAAYKAEAKAAETGDEDSGGWLGVINDGLGWANGPASQGAQWLTGAASDGADWAIGTASESAEWVEGKADDGLGWATDQATQGWESLEDWIQRTDAAVRQELDEAETLLKSVAVEALLDYLLEQKLILNLAVSTSPILVPFLPAIREEWNRRAVPAVATWLQEAQEKPPETGDDAPTGDLEARIDDEAFPRRSSSDAVGGPNPFTVDGENSTEIGRNAVIQALEDTADIAQILEDEFQIVDHGNGSYTIVLPGVTDLSHPNGGLSTINRTVRDTDYAAARSMASSSIADNEYAQMVRDYVEMNVPRGSKLSFVSHSFGADTAIDLASDPNFNGRDYVVTHVVAAAYDSEPQLEHVQGGTQVLVLQNDRDIPVKAEQLGHWTSPWDTIRRSGNRGYDRDNINLVEFDGGREGFGHAQSNYIDYVDTTSDAKTEEFFASFASEGYGDDGDTTAVDVSVPPEN